MRAVSTLLLVGFALVGAASVAIAQPFQAPPPAAAGTGATGPYAGAGPHAFYDVQGRIDHLQQAISGLPPGQAHRAASQLKSIRGELKYRMSRHNGQLLDFDRELIGEKLDHLVAQYPALKP